MRVTHWAALGIGVTFIIGGVPLVLSGWQGVGWLLVVAGVAIALASVSRVESSSGTARESGPDVYVEFDADLSLTPDAAFVVHNGGPGAVHDVQISAMENAGKTMTFDLLPNIEDDGRRTPRFQILDRNGMIIEQYRTMESLVGGRLWPRNWTRFLQDRIVGTGSFSTGSRLGGFETVKIPFTVTFVRLGGRSGVRRHTLFFDPGTRRANVRAVTPA